MTTKFPRFESMWLVFHNQAYAELQSQSDQYACRSHGSGSGVQWVWGAMLEAYHKLQPKPKTIPEMEIALQQIWTDLPQTPINKAVNDFRKRLQACISAGGGHFEHAL